MAYGQLTFPAQVMAKNSEQSKQKQDYQSKETKVSLGPWLSLSVQLSSYGETERKQL